MNIRIFALLFKHAGLVATHHYHICCSHEQFGHKHNITSTEKTS